MLTVGAWLAGCGALGGDPAGALVAAHEASNHSLPPDAAPLDRDGDGLPDAWEEFYGLDPTDPADASLDYDDDGRSNLREFLDQTDPLLPTLSAGYP
jgi:hypothetical protein